MVWELGAFDTILSDLVWHRWGVWRALVSYASYVVQLVADQVDFAWVSGGATAAFVEQEAQMQTHTAWMKQGRQGRPGGTAPQGKT